jgi:mRNA interferase RelE/StbE
MKRRPSALDSKVWILQWKEEAIEDLEKIDSIDARLIKEKIEDFLIKDPLNIAKPLRENLKGIYSYRIGIYRVLFTLQHQKLILLIIQVKKRDKVYKHH